MGYKKMAEYIILIHVHIYNIDNSASYYTHIRRCVVIEYCEWPLSPEICSAIVSITKYTTTHSSVCVHR